MCKSKMSVDASDPNLTPRRNSRTQRSSGNTNTPQTPRLRNTLRSQQSDPSTSINTSANYSSGSSYRLDSSTATASVISSRTSLSSLRNSLPENPHIYDFSEIRSATNNFLAKRFSSSSSPSWRCILRGKEAVVFQRKFRRSIENSGLKEKLSVVCKSHHMSIVKLLGASISGEHIYLVYEFMQGANLSDCLRNSRNPDFTVLSTWMSRMQVATDLAHGLDYIHNNTGLNMHPVHKYVKSNSVIVTEPSFNAKICHFGTAELCGETEIEDPEEGSSKLKRSNSRLMQFQGVMGYMSPEFQLSGVATQKSDVYAFGVMMLELLSGDEPLKFKFDKKSGEYRKLSVIEAARSGVEGGEGVLRRWLDRRLNDSFPVEVAEKVTRVALECVDGDPDMRPNMRRVAGKISKLYLESRIWSDKVRVPTDFSVSFAPR